MRNSQIIIIQIMSCANLTLFYKLACKKILTAYLSFDLKLKKLLVTYGVRETVDVVNGD
jgi:hypothetical protein